MIVKYLGVIYAQAAERLLRGLVLLYLRSKIR